MTSSLPAGGRAWLAALAIGAVGLVLALVVGQLGIFLGLALAMGWLGLYVLARRDRVTVISGLLTGLGLAWMVMFLVAYAEARMNDPVAWLLAGIALLGLGAGAGVLAANGIGQAGTRRGGPPSMSRDDSIGYFRDFNAPGSGVHEEDEPRRWGRGDEG